jgi:hypothetical protein
VAPAITRVAAALERATCKVMCHFMMWMEEGGHDIIPVLTKLRSKDKQIDRNTTLLETIKIQDLPYLWCN